MTVQAKQICRDKTKYLVKKRRVTKSKVCQWCNKFGRTEAHHEDYAKPEVVVWLCPKCHRKYHNKRRKYARYSKRSIDA